MILADSPTRMQPVDGFDYGYGRLSSNFGSTNLDNIPSSGGSAGYTRALPSSPTPVTVIPVTASGTSAQPSVNPTQSGDINATLQSLIDLYGSQFTAPSQASTSGGPVVVVPDPQTQSTGSAGVSPQLVGLVALVAVGFLAWRAYRHKAAA